MLPGAGPVHGQGTHDQPFVERLATGHVVLVFGVHQQDDVEIAVAHMADDRCQEAAFVDVAAGFEDALGEARDRHADIGGHALRSRLERQAGVIGIVAGLPQAVAVFGLGRPLEFVGAEIAGDGLDNFDLFDDALFGTVEFEKQGRFERIIELRELVDGVYLDLVQKLDPGHRDAHLDGLNHRADRRFQVRERAHGRRHGFRDAVKADRHLGDDAERPFRADEQPRQVVAGRRLAGPAAGADDAPVGQDHGQGQHVLAHGAVAHRVGTRRPGRRHAAERRIGAGIDGEEQPRIAEVLVQLLAGDAGLNGGVHVLGVDFDDFVHSHQVDAHPAVQCRHVAFQRGAGAEGNDRHVAGRAQLDDVADFLGGLGEHHRIGWMAGMVGFVVAVLFAHRLGDREPVADDGAERRDQVVVDLCRLGGHSRPSKVIVILG